MNALNLQELKCPRCGGELEEPKNGTYHCPSCERNFVSEAVTKYNEVLSALEKQRREDVNRLKRDMWEKAHRKDVHNAELKQVCEKILQLVDNDLYAKFYLATCKKDPADLTECLSKINIKEHAEDIPEFLDYLITALRPEWFLVVADLIDRAYTGTENRVYWHDKYDQKAKLVDDGVFDPQINRDVFVAYSGKDMLAVEKLVNTLEDSGLTCFLAARNLQHGSGAEDNYYKDIHRALEHCDVFVFVSSSNSRNAQCDVYKCEMPYVEKHLPQMLRVEYLIEKPTGKAIEQYFRKFFKNLDWCERADKVANRIVELLANKEQCTSSSTQKSEVEKRLQDQLDAERAAREAAEKAAAAVTEKAEMQRELEEAKNARLKAEKEAQALAKQEKAAHKTALKRERAEAKALAKQQKEAARAQRDPERAREVCTYIAFALPTAVIVTWFFYLILFGAWEQWQIFIGTAIPILVIEIPAWLYFQECEDAYSVVGSCLGTLFGLWCLAPMVFLPFGILEALFQEIAILQVAVAVLASIYFLWFLFPKRSGYYDDVACIGIAVPLGAFFWCLIILFCFNTWEHWQHFIGVALYGGAILALSIVSQYVQQLKLEEGQKISLHDTTFYKRIQIALNLAVFFLIAFDVAMFWRLGDGYRWIFTHSVYTAGVASLLVSVRQLAFGRPVAIPLVQNILLQLLGALVYIL